MVQGEKAVVLAKQSRHGRGRTAFINHAWQIRKMSGKLHCIAPIKLPKMMNRITPSHVCGMLVQAHDAFHQIQFKAQPLHRPPIGECYFELKGLDADLNQVPANGSVVEDGYDWRGPVNRSTVPIDTNPRAPNASASSTAHGSPANRTVIEITQFFGGYWDENPMRSVLRVEYRLLAPNNRLFMIHYLLLDSNGVTVDLGAEMAKPKQPVIMHPNQQLRPAVQAPIQVRPPPAQPSKTIASNQPPQSQRKPAQLQRPINPQEEASFMAVDDDSAASIDISYARLRLVRGLMTRLFIEEPKQLSTPESPEGLCELLDDQIALLKSDLQQTKDIVAVIRDAESERRHKLNNLFDSVMDDEADMDYLIREWQANSGYSIDNAIL